MLRFIKRGVLALLPVAFLLLAFGAAPAAPGVGVQNVNLACNDGTNLALALDAATVTQLSDAVSAINLYPAGDPALACNLTQSTPLAYTASRTFSSRTLSSAASPNAAGGNGGNPQWDYAVGGGRAIIVTRCAPQEDNFGFDAKVDPALNGTTGTGHFNLTIPACTSTNTGTTYNASHLNMTVDCLKVNGTTGDAELTAAVNKATGLFASSAEFPSGLKEISFKLHDSGMSGGTGDLIGWDFGTASRPCDFHANDYATVDNGNINVHQAP